MRFSALMIVLSLSVSGFATEISLSGFRANALMDIAEFAKPDSVINLETQHVQMRNVYCEKVAKESRRLYCSFIYSLGNQDRKAMLVDEMAEKFRQLLLEGSAGEFKTDLWMRVIRLKHIDCKRLPRPADVSEINYDPQARCVFTAQ